MSGSKYKERFSLPSLPLKQAGGENNQPAPGPAASFAIDLYLKQPLLVLPLLKVRHSASVCDRDGLGSVASERGMMAF